jgi:hypothetical protein
MEQSSWADEQLRGMEDEKGDTLQRTLPKFVLAFWDEALVLIILAYATYRFLG